MEMKEGNVLFNDGLYTFYLRLYGVRHMVKYNTDSERGNPLPPHGLLFLFNSKGLFYAPSHRQDSTYHCLWYTSRGALAGMQPYSQHIKLFRVGHMVKDHSNSERRNPLPPQHELLFPISSKAFFISTIPQTG